MTSYKMVWSATQMLCTFNIVAVWPYICTCGLFWMGTVRIIMSSVRYVVYVVCRSLDGSIVLVKDRQVISLPYTSFCFGLCFCHYIFTVCSFNKIWKKIWLWLKQYLLFPIMIWVLNFLYCHDQCKSHNLCINCFCW